MTHRGRELNEVEKYDRTMSSDEDEDVRGRGSIGANIVDAVHFGGGIAASAQNAAGKRCINLSFLSNLKVWVLFIKEFFFGYCTW